jgi:hypothetical protein
MHWSRWSNLNSITSKEYTCGYCGSFVGSSHGYIEQDYRSNYIVICTNCAKPTFFDHNGNQFPGPLIGREIKHLPSDIETIYKEMRENLKNSAFTSTISLGRKLIMHLAVNVAEAPEGETFVKYVEYLKTSGYIPPNGINALDYMRKLGNEKNHELKVGTKDEAEKVIKFIEMLLIFMYEIPSEFQNESLAENN